MALVCQGLAGAARPGLVWPAEIWHGATRQVRMRHDRYVSERSGSTRIGRFGKAATLLDRSDSERSEAVWQVRSGHAFTG